MLLSFFFSYSLRPATSPETNVRTVGAQTGRPDAPYTQQQQQYPIRPERGVGLWASTGTSTRTPAYTGTSWYIANNTARIGGSYMRVLGVNESNEAPEREARTFLSWFSQEKKNAASYRIVREVPCC